MEETVDDLLRASQQAELQEKANARREQIAWDLEHLAMDVRIDRNSPLCAFIVFIEPDKTTMHYAGKDIDWDDVGEARMAFMDMNHAKFQSAEVKLRPDEVVIERSIQRKVLKEIEERKIAARHTEFAYKCHWCDYRSKTRRGKEQHERIQLKQGCIECGTPRCKVRGASYDYSTDYKGIMTCQDCWKK